MALGRRSEWHCAGYEEYLVLAHLIRRRYLITWPIQDVFDWDAVSRGNVRQRFSSAHRVEHAFTRRDYEHLPNIQQLAIGKLRIGGKQRAEGDAV
jgi:hypothetical protein